MNEQRFTKECGNNGMTCRIWDNGLPMTTDEVVDTLNEQQFTIQSLKEDKAIAEDYANIFEKENVKLRKQIDEQQAIINELKAQLREKEQDEQLYANEIVKLNKEAKEVLDFKSLGGDY